MLSRFPLICLLSCCSIFANAQFFLNPSIGIGRAGTNTNNFSTPFIASKTTSYHALMGLGKKLNRIHLTSGFGYFKTGYCFKDLTVATTVLETVDYYLFFEHLYVPVTVGYEFALGSWFAVVPELGADVSYNFGEHSKMVYEDRTVKSGLRSLSGRHRVSVFVDCGINMLFKLKGKTSFTLKPSVKYMATNFLISPVTEHNYAFFLSAGVRLSSSRRTKKTNAPNN
jgi:hypothetical protein